jgi:hypothetical protein
MTRSIRDVRNVHSLPRCRISASSARTVSPAISNADRKLTTPQRRASLRSSMGCLIFCISSFSNGRPSFPATRLRLVLMSSMQQIVMYRRCDDQHEYNRQNPAPHGHRQKPKFCVKAHTTNRDANHATSADADPRGWKSRQSPPSPRQQKRDVSLQQRKTPNSKRKTRRRKRDQNDAKDGIAHNVIQAVSRTWIWSSANLFGQVRSCMAPLKARRGRAASRLFGLNCGVLGGIGNDALQHGDEREFSSFMGAALRE